MPQGGSPQEGHPVTDGTFQLGRHNPNPTTGKPQATPPSKGRTVTLRRLNIVRGRARAYSRIKARELDSGAPDWTLARRGKCVKGTATATDNAGTRVVEEVKGQDPRLRAEAETCAVTLEGSPFIFREYPAGGLRAKV